MVVLEFAGSCREIPKFHYNHGQLQLQLYSKYLQQKIHWDWPAVREAIRGRPGYIICYKLQRN